MKGTPSWLAELLYALKTLPRNPYLQHQIKRFWRKPILLPLIAGYAVLTIAHILYNWSKISPFYPFSNMLLLDLSLQTTYLQQHSLLFLFTIIILPLITVSRVTKEYSHNRLHFLGLTPLTYHHILVGIVSRDVLILIIAIGLHLPLTLLSLFMRNVEWSYVIVMTFDLLTTGVCLILIACSISLFCRKYVTIGLSLLLIFLGANWFWYELQSSKFIDNVELQPYLRGSLFYTMCRQGLQFAPARSQIFYIPLVTSFRYFDGKERQKLPAQRSRSVFYKADDRYVPSLDLLSHRISTELANFKLTEKSFKNLRAEKMPEDVLASLKPLKNKIFPTKEVFLTLVKEHIEEKQFVSYKTLILKHVDKLHLNETFKINFTDSIKKLKNSLDGFEKQLSILQTSLKNDKNDLENYYQFLDLESLDTADLKKQDSSTATILQGWGNFLQKKRRYTNYGVSILNNLMEGFKRSPLGLGLTFENRADYKQQYINHDMWYEIHFFIDAARKYRNKEYIKTSFDLYHDFKKNELENLSKFIKAIQQVSSDLLKIDNSFSTIQGHLIFRNIPYLLRFAETSLWGDWYQSDDIELQRQLDMLNKKWTDVVYHVLRIKFPISLLSTNFINSSNEIEEIRKSLFTKNLLKLAIMSIGYIFVYTNIFPAFSLYLSPLISFGSLLIYGIGFSQLNFYLNLDTYLNILYSLNLNKAFEELVNLSVLLLCMGIPYLIFYHTLPLSKVKVTKWWNLLFVISNPFILGYMVWYSCHPDSLRFKEHLLFPYILALLSFDIVKQWMSFKYSKLASGFIALVCSIFFTLASLSVHQDKRFILMHLLVVVYAIWLIKYFWQLFKKQRREMIHGN